MVYGLIPKIRKLAGINATFEHGVKCGLGDGSKTEFQIPSVGNRNFFFVDKDASTTSTITANNDVVAYDAGVSATISSIDEDSGKITLSVAPALNNQVTADYLHSEVSDADVILAMEIAEEMTDHIIRGKNEVVASYIQTEDGNGIDTVFPFDHADVTAVSSVTVDGVAKTLNTDYWLYKHSGDSTRYWYIRFKTPPAVKEQSIVIDYAHGEVKKGVTRLAELLAAKYILLEIKPSRSSGMWVKGERGSEKSDISRLQQIMSEIKMLKLKYDRRTKYEST